MPTDSSADSSEPPDLDAALAAVEREYDCTVLAARDTGSRAWGLSDRDSDYDVTVLFRQPAVAYATLGESVATIETEYGDDLELTGWNVSRFAELLVESNPSALEFLHSPRRYREFEPLAALEADVGESFEPIALYHHFRSLADRQYHKYLERRLLEDGHPAYVVVDETDDEWICVPGDADSAAGPAADSDLQHLPKTDGHLELGACDQTVKRTLYVVRAVLYARYIRDRHRFPTLDFPAFLDEIAAGDPDIASASVVERTRDLVRRKRAGEGDAVVGQVFTAAELSLPSKIPPATHAVGGIATARVNEFVRASFATEKPSE
ncbi:nucleotidyltransferase domain-containing protein [Haloarchaeobius sp. DFWS5]|uniref:nucleotidyltransferase domain-containing protein n=1 Tax=Haloarchaeobius sp. DFWS5 TaxID=3446114 RepID=UPI003EC139B5